MSDEDDHFQKIDDTCSILEGGGKQAELQEFKGRDKKNYSVFGALHHRQTRVPIEINIDQKQMFLEMDDQQALDYLESEIKRQKCTQTKIEVPIGKVKFTPRTPRYKQDGKVDILKINDSEASPIRSVSPSNKNKSSSSPKKKQKCSKKHGNADNSIQFDDPKYWLMQSPQNVEEESNYLNRVKRSEGSEISFKDEVDQQIEELLEESQHKYIDKVFKLILSKCDLSQKDVTHRNHHITRFIHPIPNAEGENLARHRDVDVIRYQMQNYLILREARKDELADEITYHIMVYSFNLKSQIVEQILEKQLNKDPIDSSIAGFHNEKASYFRDSHQIYYFVAERDTDFMKDKVTLFQFDLLSGKETIVKTFQKNAIPNCPLLVVQISKDTGYFGHKSNIERGPSELEQVLNTLFFKMIYLTSNDYFREDIYSMSNIQACIQKIEYVSESSPSGLFYFSKEMGAIHQMGDLRVKRNFLAWIGKKYGKPQYKFLDFDRSPSRIKEKDLDLKMLIPEYITYHDVSDSEATQLFLERINLLLQDNEKAKSNEQSSFPTFFDIQQDTETNNCFIRERKAPKFKKTFERIRNKYILNFMYNYRILELKDTITQFHEDQVVALKKAFDSEVMDLNQDGLVTLSELKSILERGVQDTKRKNPEIIIDEEAEVQKMINQMIDWKCNNQSYCVMIDRLSNNFTLIINNWKVHQDELLFITFPMPGFHIQKIEQQFQNPQYSPQQKTIDQVVQYCGEKPVVWLTNFSFANIVRDEKRVYVSFKDQETNEQVLKVIDDLDHEFNFFPETKLSFFSNEQSPQLKKFLKEGQQKYNVAFWDNCSLFFDFQKDEFYSMGKDPEDHFITLALNKHSLEDGIAEMSKNWQDRSRLQIICQRGSLHQDDRMEVPLLAVESYRESNKRLLKKVWINVIDLKNWKVLQAIDIDLLGIELDQLSSESNGLSIKDRLSLSASSRIKLVQNRGVGDNASYSQDYQVAIMFEEWNRVKIIEYKILWTSLGLNGKEHKGFEIDILFVGQKEILIHETFKLRKFDFYPVYDQLCDLTSTRLRLFQKSLSSDDNEYIDVDAYFKNYNYHSSNDILNFGYKIITKRNTDKVDALITEVQLNQNIKEFSTSLLSDLRKGSRDFNIQSTMDIDVEVFSLDHSRSLSNHAISKIFQTQIRNLMSMMPFDFLNWSQRTQNYGISLFRPIQLLQGHSFADFYLSDAQLLNQMICESNAKTKIQDKNFDSLIEQILSKENNRGFRKVYQELGILTQHHEMCSDFHIINPIQRCLSEKGRSDKMDSIDVMLRASLTLQTTASGQIQDILMQLFPQIVNSKSKSHQIDKFLTEGSTAFEMLDTCTLKAINADDVPQPYALRLSNASINQSDLNPFISEHILKSQKPPENFNFLLNHHFIDLRPFLVTQTLRNLSNLNDLQSTQNIFNSERISKTLLNISIKYDFVIEQSLAVRSLIDHQYKTTLRFNQLYFLIFFFGFFVPFTYIQSTDAKNWWTATAMFVCFCTQSFKAGVEVMKMGAKRSLSKMLNIDGVSPMLFLIYQYMRIQQHVSGWYEDEKGVENEHEPVYERPYQISLFDEIEIQLKAVIFVISVFQVVKFMRMFQICQKMIGLHIKVGIDVASFVGFFVLIVLAFALLYQSLDLQISQEEESTNGEGFIKFVIFALRTSFGQQDPPVIFETRSSQLQAYGINGIDSLIFIAWVWNQIFMIINFVNFSIAVVNNSYKEGLEHSLVAQYKYRACANQDFQMFLKACRIIENFDVFIISVEAQKQAHDQVTQPAEATVVLESIDQIKNQMILQQQQMRQEMSMNFQQLSKLIKAQE